MLAPIRKPKVCKECGDEFIPYSTTQKVCSTNCAIPFGKKEAAKKADKQHKERKKEFLANDISYQREKAQTAFNAYIRWRDRNLGCVSCNKGPNWQGQWCAGHFHTRGARPDLAFNEDNCHKQCNRDCNQGKSGNVGPYREELIRRIGIERVEALEIQEIKNWRASDYAEIAKHYRQKLKEAKKADE